MSQFDPNIFLNAETTEANEKRPPIPVENPDDPNGLYTAVIGEIGTASGTIGRGERTGQPWFQLIVPMKLQLPPSVQALGLPAELQLTDRPMLDVTESGSMDNSKGKNNALRIYREATGLNKKGEVFAPRMLGGKVVKVKIAHEDYQGAIVEKIKNVLPS